MENCESEFDSITKHSQDIPTKLKHKRKQTKSRTSRLHYSITALNI